MRITSKGQVTIPVWIRRQLGLLPETEVAFVVEDDGVRIVKAYGSARGRRAVGALRSRASVRMTTDQILGLTRRS
jgi:AbrB family looped-hinge helix DNA binding protein